MRGSTAVAKILKMEGIEFTTLFPHNPIIDAVAELDEYFSECLWRAQAKLSFFVGILLLIDNRHSQVSLHLRQAILLLLPGRPDFVDIRQAWNVSHLCRSSVISRLSIRFVLEYSQVLLSAFICDLGLPGPLTLEPGDASGCRYSTVAIVGKRIYTTGAIDGDCVITALGMDGKEVWTRTNGKA